MGINIWLYTIASVVIVSILSVIGVLTLSLHKKTLARILFFLVSFAVGALLGDVFIHLLPEALEQIQNSLLTALLTIGGFLLFFILEKFIRWQHHYAVHSHHHIKPVVTMNIVGDAAHNLIDGVLIGASYSISIPIGITTTLAIVLHEIPQEIGDFGVLVNGGLSVGRALFFNLLAALMAIIGAIMALVFGNHFHGAIKFLLPITAGGFIYIAGPDLIPELQHEIRISNSVLQFLAIAGGVSIMAILSLLE